MLCQLSGGGVMLIATFKIVDDIQRAGHSVKADTASELARQLRITAEKLESGEVHGDILRDKDGSFIGNLDIEEE